MFILVPLTSNYTFQKANYLQILEENIGDIKSFNKSQEEVSLSDKGGKLCNFLTSGRCTKILITVLIMRFHSWTRLQPIVVGKMGMGSLLGTVITYMHWTMEEKFKLLINFYLSSCNFSTYTYFFLLGTSYTGFENVEGLGQI